MQKFSSRDSYLVTYGNTNLPIYSLSIGERTLNYTYGGSKLLDMPVFV